MPARITFIAHAATEAQRKAAFPIDEPILEREQARIARATRSFPTAGQVWSAPEQRARQTCRALELPVRIADELRDCDYGTWRGKTMDNLQNEDPDGLLAWLTDPGAIPHGGESIEDLIRRAGRWIDGQPQVKHAIAFTHPAVIRGAVVHALRLPAAAFWRLEIAPLSLTDLRFNSRVWNLRCAGCPLGSWPLSEDGSSGEPV